MHTYTQARTHTPAEIQVLQFVFSVLSKEVGLQRGVDTLGLLRWPLCAAASLLALLLAPLLPQAHMAERSPGRLLWGLGLCSFPGSS